MSSILFFFFQAEDGIRDLTVTGVQTCALPIWGRSRVSPRRVRAPQARRGRCRPEVRKPQRRPHPPARRVEHRSEERRVGKECRSRWAPHHLKKKKKEGKEHVY